MLDSQETASHLEGHLARVLRKVERTNTEQPLIRSVAFAVPTGIPTDTCDNKNNGKMKLPKLNLPTFEGNILYWQEFWDNFSTSVLKQDIPDIQSSVISKVHFVLLLLPPYLEFQLLMIIIMSWR